MTQQDYDERTALHVAAAQGMSPNMNMHVLLCVLDMFHMVLVGRICINII